MENKDLDRLFKEGLSQDSRFSNAEEQWATVANRLKEDNKRRGLWFPLLWVPLLGFVCTAFSTKFALDVLIQQQGYNTSTYYDIPLIKEKNNFHQADVVLTDITRSQNIRKKNTIVDVSSNELGFTEEVLLNTGVPSIQNKEENCSCPEEQPESIPIIIKEDKNDMVYQAIDFFDKIPPCDLLMIKEKVDKHDISFFVDIKKEKRLGGYIFAGANQDFNNDSKLVDTLQPTYHLGVGWRFKKRWQLAATYSQRSVKVGTSAIPKTFNIPTDALPYETPYPDFTAVNYRSENIDLSLSFNLIHQNQLKLGPVAGIQLRRASQIQVAYYFEGAYVQEIYYERIDDDPFKLSQAIVGGRLEIPIYKYLSLESHYKYLISLQPASFDWRNQHRIQIGLMHHF